MKTCFFLIFLFFSIISFGQDYLCFNSSKEAKSFIIGNWKEKDVSSNIIYKFVIKDNIINIEILEDLDYYEEANNELVFNSNDRVIVNKLEDCFVIDILYEELTGSISYELKFITKDNFEYGERVFERIKI